MDITEEATQRIKACGYDGEVDTSYLSLLQGDQEQYIKDFCNISTIPAELQHVLSKRTAGAFLREQYALGTVGGDDVSSITEGDVSMSFGNATKLKDVITAYLDDSELMHYRRLAW